MTVDARTDEADTRRAHANLEAAADAAAADKRLHGELAAIVRAGIEAGAFADPLDGRTWTPAWRAVLALTALRFHALARRGGVGPLAPRALATPALLDVLASLESEPGGPSESEPGGPSELVRVVATLPAARGGGGRVALPPATSRAQLERTPAPSPTPASSSSSGARPLALQLLADIRGTFEREGDPERIASAALDRALRALPDRPWRSMPSTGKPLSAQGRGRMLAAVGIRARTLQFAGAKDAKGYERTAFEPAWRALL